jgi:serine/threonine protein phosphatase 1
MLSRVLRRSAWRVPARPRRRGLARAPDGTAIYAIGDVHGRADLLDEMLRRIELDARDNPGDRRRFVVCLGDYVDRGPASRQVLETLSQAPMSGFDLVALRGNHDQAMLDYLEGRGSGAEWLSYGGSETLMSYGIALREIAALGPGGPALRERVLAAVPARHVGFLRGCALHCLIGDYLFVHAGVRPGVALDAQDARDLLWIRDEFLQARRPLPGKVVVHGHTIAGQPETLEHRINVDTGAFFSGRLSAVVLRDTDRRFLCATDKVPG